MDNGFVLDNGNRAAEVFVMPQRVRTVTVDGIMTREVLTASIDLTLRDVGRIMGERDISSVIIMSGTAPVGMITQTDVMRALAKDIDLAITPVRDVMSSPLMFVGPGTKLDRASEIMSRLRIKRLPIMDMDRLVGIVTDHDIMKVLPDIVRMEDCEPFDMSQVFLIRDDGKVLFHHKKKDQKLLDEDLVGGMLAALEHFIKHVMVDVEPGKFDTFNYGNLTITLRKGKHIYLAIFLTGEVPDEICSVMDRVVEDVEREFEEYIRRWDGDSFKTGRFHDYVTKELNKDERFAKELF